MKNYEKLKKVIQEAVPEIMELKMGCKVKDNYGNELSYCGKRKDGSREFQVMSDGNFISEIEENDFNGKILGRPIRLADVLVAIGSSKVKEIIMVDLEGEFNDFGDYCAFCAISHGEEMPKWNFTDNNLDHQSNECKEFLIKLLVTN